MSTSLPPPPGQEPSTRPGVRRGWTLAGQLSRLLLGILYAGAACFGVLVTPPVVVLVIGGSMAVVAAGFTAATCQRHFHRPARQRELVAAGAAGAGALPFVSGVDQLGHVGALVWVAVLFLSAACLVDWEASTAAPAVPLDLLFRQWHATEEELRGGCTGSRHRCVVRQRELLVEELHRRDPEGVRRWLADPARGPEHHVREDRG